MEFVTKINMDGDAFADGHTEITRILRHAADRIEQLQTVPIGKLFDVNGNTVGYVAKEEY